MPRTYVYNTISQTYWPSHYFPCSHSKHSKNQTNNEEEQGHRTLAPPAAPSYAPAQPHPDGEDETWVGEEVEQGSHIYHTY